MSNFLDVPGVKPAALDAAVRDKINDPTSVTATALNATYVPKWKATTAYLAGDKVLSPSGDVVSAKVDFTSGASYSAANWDYSPTYVPADTDQNIAGSKTFTSLKGLRSTTFFGLGAGVGSDRMPFYQNSLIDGSALSNTLAAGGGDDYVGHQVNITFKGGFAALKTSLTASMTSGSAILTATAGTFTDPVKAGYTVVVPGAGAAGGTLKAKINSITDSTHAVLSVAASTTVTGAAVIATLAADHNFLFGANDFFVTGSSAGDLAGIDNLFGRLMEVHLQTPGATLGTIKATSSEAAIEASANGSTIGTVIGHHVKAVANKSTSTIANAYGMFIEGAAPANTTTAYALYIDGGGKTKFTGPTTLAGTAAADTPLTLQAPLNPTGQLLQGYDVTLTNRVFHIATNGAISSNSFLTAMEGLGGQVTIGSVTGGFAGIRMGSGTDAELRRTASGIIENSGKHKWVAGNVQATVGAAGAASALPATPSKYLKVVGDDGTTYVIPAYAAA
jgi:hypothetical protein